MRKLKLIMLETADSTKITKNKAGLVEWKENISAIDILGNDNVNIHLYLIDTDAEIKEGDWVYHPEVSQEYTIIKKGIKSKGLHPAQGIFKYKPTTNSWYDKCSKIIASTDSSLKLPLLSEQSIKLLVDYYNQNGKMPEFVEVEEIRKYDKNPEFYGTGMFNNGYKEIIKLNSENQVDITIPEENTLQDIIDCIIKFDDTESLENKGKYFEVIQRDLKILTHQQKGQKLMFMPK